MHNYLELKSQVEAKWDIISMLCLLLIFLAVAAAVYAMMRPYFVIHKVLALVVAFPLAYGAAYLSVHKGLAPEFYEMACTEFMNKLGYKDPLAGKMCAKKNPITLSRVQRE